MRFNKNIAIALAILLAICSVVYAQGFTKIIGQVSRTSITALETDVTALEAIFAEWTAPLPDWPDTTETALDSTTVKAVFNVDGLEGRKKLLYVYGNVSTPATADSTVWANTFYPLSLDPDSLTFWLHTTDADSTSVCITVKNPAGTTLFSTGIVTCDSDNTWTYKAFAFSSFADYSEYAIVYRVLVYEDTDAVSIGQARFK